MTEREGLGFLEVIETPRLILRAWNDEDVERWADMNADPRVMEFFVSTQPREQSYESAKWMRENLERNRYGWFILERKDRPGFSGVIAIDDVRWDTPFQPPREIGWRLPVDAWGQGFATEGAAALMRYAFDTLRWPEIVAMTATLNLRSMRVMERLGMTRDPLEDFDHIRVPEGHRIRRHVLYRKSAT